MIGPLQNKLAAMERQIKNLMRSAAQSEVTGAIHRLLYADLPSAGKAGRLRFVTDHLGGTIFSDNGSQWSGQYTAPNYTVATLPTGADIVAGTWAYATNGRKPSEGVGAGTGMMAFYDGSQWRSFADGTTIAA